MAIVDRVLYRTDYYTSTVVVGLNVDATKADFICNGTADDVEINAAIDYVEAVGGGLVHVANCITGITYYDLTASVRIEASNVILEGEGRNTIFRVANGIQVNAIEAIGVEITPLYGVVVRNLQVDGNDANQTSSGNERTQNCIFYQYVIDGEVSTTWCHNSQFHGINLYPCAKTVVINNHVYQTTQHGITWYWSGSDDLSDQNVCGHNTVWNPGQHGINVKAIRESVVSSNTIYAPVFNGIRLFNARGNVVADNNIKDADFLDTTSYDSIIIDGNSTDNIITNNVLYDGDRYNLHIAVATCVDNTVIDNKFRGTDHVLNFLDAGTGTQLRTLTMRFVEGVTFVWADASPKGWEIDQTDEYAITFDGLPLLVQQVVRIKIKAVALGAPIGAGGHMHLEVIFNAGANGEAFNLAANSWTLTNHDSEETDYVADEKIHWVIEDGDVGNEIANLLGGDDWELKVKHEAGADPDGATNAVLREVLIEYV